MFCYLIDDDVDDQEFFSMALQEVNPAIQLATASNGVDALEALSNGRVCPNVIFLDLNMPKLDGWECLKRIKEIENLKNIPVIIYSTLEPPHEALTNKIIYFFLTKQPKISELVTKLKEIFSKVEDGVYVDKN